MSQQETMISAFLMTLFVGVIVITNIPSADTQECAGGARLPVFQYVCFFVKCVFMGCSDIINIIIESIKPCCGAACVKNEKKCRKRDILRFSTD